MLKPLRILLPLVLILLAGAFLIGRLSAGGGDGPQLESPEAAEEWTCSMHPQIRQPKPGLCPICAMDLIPVLAAGGEELGPTQLRLSERAEKLAELATVRVRREPAFVELSLFGTVEVDETRRAALTAWTGGRIERLHLAFAGASVEKGDPLAELYSPDLIAAQEEYLLVRGSRGEDAAREKLRLLGLGDPEIVALASSRRVRETVTLRAQHEGVVLELLVSEGDWVQAGQILFRVADLSRVWIQLEAYETDLAWLRKGQEVEIHAAALPGESFAGTLTFVDPLLNAERRTASLRVELENPAGRLKPGFFVRGKARAVLPGEEVPLLIPATAPLLTGERALVYVSLGGSLYEARELLLGPRAGEDYIVRAGLEEGERIVSRGAFKLDSALQILGGSGMMSLSGELPAPFLAQLDPLYAAYFDLSEALSLDRPGESGAILAALPAIDAGLLHESARRNWERLAARLESAARKLDEAAGLTARRVAFEPLSGAFIDLAREIGAREPVLLFHCPMAFDFRGADWIQNREDVENPYFGSEMYRCGSQEELLAEGPAVTTAGRNLHGGH